MANSKDKGKGLAHFDSKMIWKILRLPSNMKSHMDFRLAHLYLILADSRGQDQGHAYFHCELSKIVTDMANITITMIYEVARRLSISIFKFDLCRWNDVSPIYFGLLLLGGRIY